jgi:hypothetical protein
MIDVVQALELLELCADEMVREDAERDWETGRARRRPMSLTARALAKRKLNLAHLARFSAGNSRHDAATLDGPTMTLGAMIVFRTAHRFGLAGASTERSLDAVYRAVQRYVDIIPGSLQDGVDTAAIGALMADSRACIANRSMSTLDPKDGRNARPDQ